MAQQSQDEHYGDELAMGMDYAAAVNEEIADLFAAGADIVQIDEPYMQSRPDKAKSMAVALLDRALQGIAGTTAVHVCFGYAAFVKERPSGYSVLPELAACTARQISIETAQSKLDCAVLAGLGTKEILLGVLDLQDMTIETPEIVAARIRRALPYVAKERLIIAPDCGLKYLPRDIAFGKMQAMVAGAAMVRREIGS
jgi:5-methyltetrahydropteroyltriglutamate--homocysteine methyltransferase